MLRTVPPIRNRHLVREIDRGRIRELIVVVGLVALLLLPLLSYVWSHMEWIRIGYEMERLKQVRMEQAALGERLRIEKASLSSLARVEGEARGRLGLVPATGAVVRMAPEAPPNVASAAPTPIAAPAGGAGAPPGSPRSGAIAVTKRLPREAIR